ncbi:MAG: YicC family protein [Corallococcus sp.]|nr:YicC family protein [Bacillota bacterium]MCM1533566.1 YicC family protein [Corallococcus sp.]
MKSMTGYGKAVVVRDDRELTVELKSVNHRFLDVSTKIPRMFIAYEDVIRSGLSKGLSRGHVDVFINYNRLGDGGKTVSVDLSLATGYVDAAKQLAETFPELAKDFNINALMRSNEVLTLTQADEDESVLREMLVEAVDCAVAELNAMRKKEGDALQVDLLKKIDNVEGLLRQVKLYAPKVAEQYREKLTARVREALDGAVLDENKLVNEVCFFTDKSCIDEEITRLSSHIDRARELLSLSEPVGRKLDFLVQEFNRETNTICSKSSFLELTNVALEMKNEIEKIREQIQNIE